jgi:uncharacterized protein YegL
MVKQEIVAVVDRSGSMRGKEQDTVGGINAMFDELKSTKTDDDTINVTVKLFDNEQLLKVNRQNLDTYESFPLADFVPRGSTALLDAIGDTLKFFMELKLVNPGEYDSCIVYVATDGQENSSVKYNRQTIKDMINTAKKVYNINVIYMGANQDAILEAGNIGIGAGQAINYSETSENVEAAFRSGGCVATRTRTTGSLSAFTAVERSLSCHNPNNDTYSSTPISQTNTLSSPPEVQRSNARPSRATRPFSNNPLSPFNVAPVTANTLNVETHPVANQ